MLEGRVPGLLSIPGVGDIQFDQWIEGHVYDRVTLPASAISAGTEYEFFSTVANKNKADTNMSEANKLTEGWQMIVMKYGLWIWPMSAGASSSLTPELDFKKIVENSWLKFETGNAKVRKQAPTWAWPIGLGLYGVQAQDATASGPIVRHVYNIGAPAPAAVPDLLIPVRITNQLHFKATLRFEVATTPTIATDIFFCLYGFISRPIM